MMMVASGVMKARSIGWRLDLRHLPRLRSRAKRLGKLAQLIGGSGVACGLGRLSSVLKIGCDLCGKLLVFGRIGFLQFLQQSH